MDASATAGQLKQLDRSCAPARQPTTPNPPAEASKRPVYPGKPRGRSNHGTLLDAVPKPMSLEQTKQDCQPLMIAFLQAAMTQ